MSMSARVLLIGSFSCRYLNAICTERKIASKRLTGISAKSKLERRVFVEFIHLHD